MQIFLSLLLALTLILSGGYAGILLMVQIGILPGLCQLSPSGYARAWCAMDRFMGRRMPPYKVSLELMTLVTIISLAIDHHVLLSCVISISFVLSVTDMAFTIRRQLPLNAKLNSFPHGTPDHALIEIRSQTIRGVRARFALSATSFILLCFGIVFLPLSHG